MSDLPASILIRPPAFSSGRTIKIRQHDAVQDSHHPINAFTGAGIFNLARPAVQCLCDKLQYPTKPTSRPAHQIKPSSRQQLRCPRTHPQASSSSSSSCLQERLHPPPPPPPSAATEASNTTEASPSKSDSPFPYNAADSSSDPFGTLDIASIIANRAAIYGQSLGIGDPLTRPKIRAKAVTGRTVFIKDRLSPTSAPTPVVAIRVLERMCREQKVKNKYHSQKFHERKGLKKKRLRSQRWRARFKTGFKAAVSKVIELKKQGW
ncbi:hypothetical protein PT974_09796 [Cladobotryum mycophilum]|uniref:Ribosomal protein S21 n=1 Tax=Cladobotryum mycophilum TaxID=491253 RepID=A0ABR0SH72_9HYPO